MNKPLISDTTKTKIYGSIWNAVYYEVWSEVCFEVIGAASDLAHAMLRSSETMISDTALLGIKDSMEVFNEPV